MVRMLGHVDAVHALYYLMMWPLAHLFGTSELVMRLPSAIAMAVAAFGVALIGQRLGTWQTGLLAGLVFAALPMTSRYGQEARSYALVTAIAVLSSYLAIRLIDEPVRRWLVSYAASLAALGAMNIFALLIIPAHGMTLAAAKRQAQAARATRVWAAAVAAACSLYSSGYRRRRSTTTPTASSSEGTWSGGRTPVTAAPTSSRSPPRGARSFGKAEPR